MAHINQLQAIQDLEKLNFEAGDPVLVTTINTQNYASSSGTVYNYPNDVLVMYGNRLVDYALNISEEGDYSIKLSTAQMTSKNAPPGYSFNFNIKVDGTTVANVNLNASRVFIFSDFIDLGALTQGSHVLTLQWTNDTNISPYDANVGINLIELYRIPVEPPTAFFNIEQSVQITDPTPDAGGSFGNFRIGLNDLIILSDENAGSDLVFRVFDQKPGSDTFGQ